MDGKDSQDESDTPVGSRPQSPASPGASPDARRLPFVVPTLDDMRRVWFTDDDSYKDESALLGLDPETVNIRKRWAVQVIAFYKGEIDKMGYNGDNVYNLQPMILGCPVEARQEFVNRIKEFIQKTLVPIMTAKMGAQQTPDAKEPEPAQPKLPFTFPTEPMKLTSVKDMPGYFFGKPQPHPTTPLPTSGHAGPGGSQNPDEFNRKRSTLEEYMGESRSNSGLLYTDSITTKDLESIKEIFSFNALNALSWKEFTNFGMRNSHIYRKMFEGHVKSSNLSAEAVTFVIATTTFIKNKTRAVQALRALQTKIENEEGSSLKALKDDISSAARFISNKTEQYTSNASANVIPIVSIPSCAPFLAAACWKKLTKPEDISVSSFLRNLWAAQLNLDIQCLKYQRRWEKFFWNYVVKKGSKNYIPGFQREFWATKAGDNYSLLDANGEVFYPKDRVKYQFSDLAAWLSNGDPYMFDRLVSQPIDEGERFQELTGKVDDVDYWDSDDEKEFQDDYRKAKGAAGSSSATKTAAMDAIARKMASKKGK